MPISLSNPDMQVDFAATLIQLRDYYLQESLFRTIRKIPVVDLNRELSEYANSDDLSVLAGKGLRGELVFSVPVIFRKAPQLLGYYRLLLGYSQKAFYGSETGLSPLKSMEEKGTLTASCESRLPELCRALNGAASYLINSISERALTKSFLDDLALLTLGPQLRGGANVKKGARSIVFVFEKIRALVEKHIIRETPRVLEIVNAAGRTVLIEFSSDPDIIIRERLSSASDNFRNIIAIEVKGGTDFSNIHNRIGEAEKSHQKARKSGYTECWTVVNVDKMNLAMSKSESPSTDRFYLLSSLIRGQGSDYLDFKSRIASLTGIPTIQGK